MDLNELTAYGWNENYLNELQNYSTELANPLAFVGRVSKVQRNRTQILTTGGEKYVSISKKLTEESFKIAVGDWVVGRYSEDHTTGVITAFLNRQSTLSRKVVGGKIDEQLIASNIDICFVVTALNDEFNLKRMERFLTATTASGLKPVLLLNKADLVEESDVLTELRERFGDELPVHKISAKTGDGFEALEEYLQKGKTLILIGSSGVGKSSIINYLLQEERQLVNTTSKHLDKGQHTTTERSLLVLPSGALLVDTPGMREVELWASDDDVDESFKDIETFFRSCRFVNCKHDSEPGCAVWAAIDEGTLQEDRFVNYKKIRKEAATLERLIKAKEQKKERKILKHKKRSYEY